MQEKLEKSAKQSAFKNQTNIFPETEHLNFGDFLRLP